MYSVYEKGNPTLINGYWKTAEFQIKLYVCPDEVQVWTFG
jgi:hypothetical protein